VRERLGVSGRDRGLRLEGGAGLDSDDDTTERNGLGAAESHWGMKG
jgi:hypothetical protein